MSGRFQTPRGTEDILPEEQPYWRAIHDAAEEVTRLFGYERLDTPTFEDAALFEKGTGDTTDIVEKEMYSFQDQGGEALSLIPEATPAICRAYLEHGLASRPQPVRLFTIARMFRYNRPQLGRLRQFNQFDCEVLGSGTALVDAELIELHWRFYEQLGLQDLEIRLGSIDDLESRISQETDALILCNPQNPTGNCWSPEDLMRLGQLCLERRVVVLADEIHCDFVTKGQKYTPFATLPDKAVVDNSVTFQSGSKTFSLAAMKVAWFHSTNPEYFQKVQDQHMAQTNTLGVVAHHAALRGGGEWLDQLLVYLDGNHDLVEQYLREKVPQVNYTKAQGTYLAWLDVSQVAEAIGATEKAVAATETEEEEVTPEDIVVRWLVENAGVYTNPGSNYGPGGEGWVRMNLGTSRQLIQVALDNIAEAMNSL